VDAKLRAWCGGDVVLEPLPYLTRNQHIVKAVETFPVRLLIAAPHQVEEVTRSGTWSTIRYARRSRVGIPIAIVQPDGTITEEP
jgi:hypothetical protein